MRGARAATVLGTVFEALAALAAAAFSSTPAGGAELRDLWGRNVSSVAYAADGVVNKGEIEELISIAAGRPLTEEGTAATIRNLYGTRLFSDVVVDAEPVESGDVRVIIYLWRAYVVRAIEFEGKFGPTREDLRRVVPLAAGDPFHAASLEAGTSAIERRLFADGYLDPQVEPEAVFDRETFTVTALYRIQAGQRARITEPFFDGKTAPFTPSDLAARGKLDPGDVYNETKARDDAERMRKFLLGEGYYRGAVELIAAEPTEDGRIRPVYRITVGPRYEIAAEGIKPKAAAKQIRALLDYQSFDEDLLDQWTIDRRAEMQRAGHYRVKVTASASGTDPVMVKLVVEPGPKYAVESVTIDGDVSVPEDTIRSLMVTRPKGLPVIAKGRLIDTDLEGDVSAILGYYQRQGWIEAKVKSSVQDGTSPDELKVAIFIVEGPRAFVRQRQVEGAEHLTLEDLDSLLTIKVGEPFNPAALRHDVGVLTTRYQNTGWPSATVQDRYTLSEDRTAVDVAYKVEEGERAFFGRTIIRGNAFTRVERIRHQIAWKEGEPYSAEKIADTQQNLARTGVFRSIDVRPQPTNPESQTRTIDVELTEARRLSLLYGFGYQYAAGATSNRNDVFGIVGATYRNLFGRMQSATLEVQYAPISTRGYVYASFLEPFAFNTDVPINVVGFVSRTPIQDVNIDSVGGYVESARLIERYWRIGLRAEYQETGPQNPAGPLDDRARTLSEDRVSDPAGRGRPEPVLRPEGRHPRSAQRLVLDDRRQVRVSAALGGRRPLRQGLGPGRLVQEPLRRRAGAELQDRGDLPVRPRGPGAGPDRREVLLGRVLDGTGLSRRTYSGFRESPWTTTRRRRRSRRHRIPSRTDLCSAQYPNQPNEQELKKYICEPGPRIIGGNGFMAATAEFRYPILGNLGISVFYDLAQVWPSPGTISFKVEGETGLRQSIGAGLHYMTPVGPLRLEYARPVDLRTIHYQVTATQTTMRMPTGTSSPATRRPASSCATRRSRRPDASSSRSGIRSRRPERVESARCPSTSTGAASARSVSRSSSSATRSRAARPAKAARSTSFSPSSPSAPAAGAPRRARPRRRLRRPDPAAPAATRAGRAPATSTEGRFSLGPSRRARGQLPLLRGEGPPQRLRLLVGRRRETREGRLGQRLAVAGRRQACVAKRVDQLPRAERVEPGVEVAPHRGRIAGRAGDRVPHRRECAHALEAVHEKPGPEERVLAGKLLDREIHASPRARRALEHGEPGGEVREDQRVVEAESGPGARLRDEITDGLARPEGNAIGDASLEEHRDSRKPLDRSELRDLVQEVEVLRGVLLREAAHAGVGIRAHRDAAAHGLVRVRRPRPGETERVVAERDLVEPGGLGDVGILVEAVVEKIDRRRVALPGTGQRDGLVEVIVGEDHVGVRVVDPVRGDLAGPMEREREVVADLARETDTLALRKKGSRGGAVDEDQAAVDHRELGDRRSGRELPPRPGRGAREPLARGGVRRVDRRGRILPRVQDDDDEGVAGRAPGHRAEGVEEALPFAVGRNDEHVPELARDRVGRPGLGLGMLREVRVAALAGRHAYRAGRTGSSATMRASAESRSSRRAPTSAAGKYSRARRT